MKKTGTLLTLAAVLVACGGGNDSPPPSTTAPSTTTTTADEEQAVIDAYLAELNAFYAAANPPNPDHPALAETATGRLLETVRENLSELRARGVGIRKGDETQNNPEVIRLAPTAAVVEDCGVDADIQFEIATGKVIDESVITGKSVAKLVKHNGRWLVAEVSFTEQQCE